MHVATYHNLVTRMLFEAFYMYIFSEVICHLTCFKWMKLVHYIWLISMVHLILDSLLDQKCLTCDLTPLTHVGEAVNKVFIADWLSETGQTTEGRTEDSCRSGPDCTENFL